MLTQTSRIRRRQFGQCVWRGLHTLTQIHRHKHTYTRTKKTTTTTTITVGHLHFVSDSSFAMFCAFRPGCGRFLPICRKRINHRCQWHATTRNVARSWMPHTTHSYNDLPAAHGRHRRTTENAAITQHNSFGRDGQRDGRILNESDATNPNQRRRMGGLGLTHGLKETLFPTQKRILRLKRA